MQLAIILLSVDVILSLALDLQFTHSTQMSVGLLLHNSHPILQLLYIMLLFGVLLRVADGVVEAEEFETGEADGLDLAAAA